jgi:hypothetical protein
MVNTVFSIVIVVDIVVFFTMIVVGLLRAWKISGRIPTTREGMQEISSTDKLEWSPWNEIGSKRWRYVLFGLALLLVILNLLR